MLARHLAQAACSASLHDAEILTMTDQADELKVSFTCKACGANPATLRLPDDATEDSVVVCKDCGAEFGRWGDVQAAAKEKAAQALRDMLPARFRSS